MLKEYTRRRAQRIGRDAVAGLKAQGVEANFVVRGYERDTAEELRKLDETSARLGFVITGEVTPDTITYLKSQIAPVVYTSGSVVVCEILDQPEEMEGWHTDRQDEVDNALVELVNQLDPFGGNHEYDGEIFSELRDAVESALQALHGIEGEHARDEFLMRFYPFLADEEVIEAMAAEATVGA